MLCSRLLKPNESHGKVYNAIFGPVNRFLEWISRGYGHVIHWATGRRRWVILGFFAVFVAVVVLLGPRVKTEYFPHSDTDRISANIELPMGTAQDVTREFAFRLYDDVVAEVPEAQRINFTFGQADSDNTFAAMRSNGTHIISMNVRIGTSSTRERTSAEIADVIRGIMKRYPDIHRAIVSEGGGGMGGASTVKVEVYGYSFEETDRIARELRAKMSEDPSFAQVTLSRDEYTPEYQMDFDRTKLALNGLNSTTAGSAFSAAMSGTLASFYREDGEEYNIRVRYAPEFRTSIEDMENITVTGPQGQSIRMKELGRIVETQVPPTIERKDRERLITINGIVGRGAALSEAVEAAQRAIDATEIPPELAVQIAGDYEDQQDMFKDLLVLIILIIVLVYMVMASQFESFMSPFVIMFSLPFAAVGVLLGFWLSGVNLGMMSLVGIIILLGIVVKNGIVLIDYTILLRERGLGVRNAVTTAARSRLRPILMTTLTTVLGLLPMAVGTGEGSEMWKSLGVTVCWGLSVSTLVTLVLIPTVYCAICVRQENRKKKKEARV
jgi:HAE1 family hydrophobic/amphiphilic exporter-1